MKVGDEALYFYTANIAPLKGVVSALVGSDVELTVTRFGQEGKVEQCKPIHDDELFVRDVVNEDDQTTSSIFEQNFCLYPSHPQLNKLPPWVETDPAILAAKEQENGTPSET